MLWLFFPIQLLFSISGFVAKVSNRTKIYKRTIMIASLSQAVCYQFSKWILMLFFQCKGLFSILGFVVTDKMMIAALYQLVFLIVALY